MIDYAIRQEEKMAEFYQLFEKNFPSIWKRMRLQQLVMEERSHASKLLALYTELKTGD